jgi:hypothetical protein
MTLAAAIERDILRTRPVSTEAPTCFTCGRSFAKGDGRFCSTRCRAAFDNGFPPYEVTSCAPKVALGWKVIAGAATPFVPDLPRS